MADIRINDLPQEVSPNSSDFLAVDGISTRKATINNVVNSGAPVATRAKAEAGTDNNDRMTALSTKQAIDFNSVPLNRSITAGSGLIGGGTLSDNISLALSSASLSSLALADTSVQPSRQVIAGTGLSGGGVLSSNVTLNLSSSTQASLVLADTAIQEGSNALVPNGGTTGQILIKNSNSNRDTSWSTVSAATAVSYAPQSLSVSEQNQAKSNIQAADINTVNASIYGMITSNNGSWGVSISDGTYKAGSLIVSNSSSFTKNLNSAWSAGSGNGGRDTATAVVANGTYHLFALRNNMTGGFDAVFSPSTTPTVPAGHTLIGRIGSYLVNSGNTALVSFIQVLNDFYLAPVAAMAFTAPQADGLVTATAACPCPSGVSMEMKVQATIQLNSGAASVYVGDAASFSIGGMWSILFNNYVNGTDFCAGIAKTNASRQIRCQPGMNASATVTVSFGGWRDYTIPRLGA